MSLWRKIPAVSLTRTSQRAEGDHDEHVNVDNERPCTLPGRQASRRSEDDPCANFDNVEAGPDILPGLHKFLQTNDDHVKNMGVGYKEEPRVSPRRRTFRHAEDDDGENVDDDEGLNLSLGRQVSWRAEDDDDENVDSDEDTVFEMKLSQNIARDADEDSTTCQPATCETAGSAEDVDNGDRLRGSFLIRKSGQSINCRRSCAGKFRNQLYTVRFKPHRNLDGLSNLSAKRPRLRG
ncbi:hypothetical protein HPB47_014023 [Ixodes persulcatus]|uniref:Uncharacterized protein n=1 Tax=Ixodes persulcatus TaxID=34615 RepID=A0AC60QZK9_IXOPE|nr:hypothetical protein HPB47_014023 [Ixodes persulcatus]